MDDTWYSLLCEHDQVQLLGTLNGGQSFRWKYVDAEGDKKWIGVFSRHLWILKQTDDRISYKVYGSNHNEQFYNRMLSDYFQLCLDLTANFAEWSAKDAIFREAAGQFYGVRILKQELVENIFSFICSSNNHIGRISGMVEKLALLFGDKICQIEGRVYFSFPTVYALAQDGVENVLRKQGFGYRAKYINKSAKLIVNEGGDVWLNDLKRLDYAAAKRKLMTLTGVGPKVADCICLMSLDHLQSIPVDTHVYQIARKFYMPALPKRSTITTKMYAEIGDHFRALYGPLAGWAHTVLFCADLKKFQNTNG